LALTRHRQDAEDLTQDTFLRAWDKFHRFDPEMPLLPWLFTIARRLSIAALRRSRKLPEDFSFPTSSECDDRVIWLWDVAKRELSHESFSALWLHYNEELPLKEVAGILGKREGAVKVMLHRARISLSQCMKGRCAEEAFESLPRPQQEPI
jgi:RNA polymerase sigma-70 factor (ECF subfamily)